MQRGTTAVFHAVPLQCRSTCTTDIAASNYVSFTCESAQRREAASQLGASLKHRVSTRYRLAHRKIQQDLLRPAGDGGPPHLAVHALHEFALPFLSARGAP